MNEIKKNKNGKYLRISVPTLLDDDDLIKKVFLNFDTPEYGVK